MDLTGYGYRKPTKLHQPKAQTFATSVPPTASTQLSGDALRLLLKLEAKVALHEVSAHFPAVLNRIAAAWNSPAEADRCFDELLLNSRRERQGFPQHVMNELVSLRHHHATRVFPRKIDPWEQALLR